MLRHAVAIVAVSLLVCSSAAVRAHHSTTAVFDMTTRISVTGTLTKIDWINPHIHLSLDAKGDDGKVAHWVFESNPPSWYRAVGLARNDFAKALGQTVTLEGARAKDGDVYGYMLKITFPDGTSLELVNPADLK
jgi:hypothetical protein